MLKYLFLLLLVSVEAIAQRKTTQGEYVIENEKNNSRKSTLKPWEKYKTVNFDFETKTKRIDYMVSNMASYCKDGPVYCSGFKSIVYSTDIAIIDTSRASNGLIITVKMSDNNLFVFMFHYLCTFNGDHTGYTNVTYFDFKYGEVDRAAAKSFNIKNNRLYPKNNIFTEELTCGKIKFIIENGSSMVKMIVAGKDLQLDHQLF
jgi:hypothetical protein